MTKVLIADRSKPSLVMSSEIFKDKVPGCLVAIAGTGAEALEKLETEKPDLCLIDFDLPDVDGATLIRLMRNIYQGPILMSAFSDQVVEQAVSDLLFAFDDASAVLQKPICVESLAQLIDQFLVKKRRTQRRFTTALSSCVVGRAEGRGKRAPKVEGHITNISIGGACIDIESQTDLKLKKAQDLVLSVQFPVQSKQAAQKQTITASKSAGAKDGKAKTVAKKAKKTTRKVKTVEVKYKGKVVWRSKTQLGIRFSKMSEVQRSGLEDYFRKIWAVKLNEHDGMGASA